VTHSTVDKNYAV